MNFAQILADTALVQGWLNIVRHQGFVESLDWLRRAVGGVLASSTVEALFRWYHESGVEGGRMGADPNYVPPRGEIPIDPTIGQAYRYRVTATFRQPGTGRTQFRRTYLDSPRLLSGTDLTAAAAEGMSAAAREIATMEQESDLEGYGFGGLTIEAIWRRT